ncbi:hypothetical protein [Mycolicibacterium agri]|uniref:Uncharacterized protein n=1 Tax=Mycolicibacterium agri TaxID=36811 RepID=A0A7I9W5V7_MYCAG|nr:hypothetical protein [Mycolicibacterium agri]GFG52950.1 hypothetical protein MAGR_43910 [Mycolicibacterium agri]
MKRDSCKFLSGSFAALAFAHAAYATAVSSGIVEQPRVRGRRWPVGFMWLEAVLYTAVSLGLGYLGWRAQPQEQPEVSTATPTNARRPAVESETTAQAASG